MKRSSPPCAVSRSGLLRRAATSVGGSLSIAILALGAVASCGRSATPAVLDDDAAVDLGAVPRCDAPWPPTRPADGTPLPAALTEQIAPHWLALGDAMRRNDVSAVADAVCRVRRELGDFQGVPELALVHRPRPTTPVSAPRALTSYVEKLSAMSLGREPWTLADGSVAGGVQSTALRTPCHLVEWYLAVAPLAGAQRRPIEEAARSGLAWLRRVQTPNGNFPFPDLSDDAEAFLGECQARGGSPQQCRSTLPRLFELALIAKQEWRDTGSSPDKLVDGWFVTDGLGDTGGLQFDTGVCGRALLAGYRAFGDLALLAAARQAGTWAVQQRAVPNFNYNAFSAGLLAELARLDPQAGALGWAAAALAKARVGVLPGALPDGRWVDPHNARLDYHLIMLAALLRVDAVADDPWLTAASATALRRAQDELLEQGAAGTDDGLDALLLARASGRDPGDALAVLVNDAYRAGGDVQSGALALWLRAEL